MSDRKNILEEQDFEGLKKFLDQLDDSYRIIINGVLLKAIVEEIIVLRKEKKTRLKLVGQTDDT